MGTHPGHVFLTDDRLRMRLCARLEAAEARAAGLLTAHRDHLLGLARELLEKRSMGAEEILLWVTAIQESLPPPGEAKRRGVTDEGLASEI